MGWLKTNRLVLGAWTPMANGSGSGVAPDLESHFATTLYTENNTFPRTITTGVDLSDGFVLHRQLTGVASSYLVFARTAGSAWEYNDNNTNAMLNASSYSADSTSVTLSANADIAAIMNGGATSSAIWGWTKRAGFMDVVRYTGDGANRTIAHNLGVTPAMIVIRDFDNAASYVVGHNGLTSWTNRVLLDSNSAEAASATSFNSTAPTSSVFSVGTALATNGNTRPFVAYLFADDSGPNGLIRCGFYVGNGSSSGPTLSLGWQPRFLLVKNRTSGSTSWAIVDATINPGFTGNETVITIVGTGSPASLDAVAMVSNGVQITTTDAKFNTNGDTYIYMAVR